MLGYTTFSGQHFSNPWTITGFSVQRVQHFLEVMYPYFGISYSESNSQFPIGQGPFNFVLAMRGVL